MRELKAMLEKHRGQYVAIHDEKIAAVGSSLTDVVCQVHSQHGKVAMFAELVSDEPPRVIRIPSPRVVT